MLGIIKKDFYDTFCIPKNLLSNICGYALLPVSMLVLGSNEWVMMLFLIVCIPATSIAVLQAAMAQDEKVRFDDIMLTYPLSKRKIVLARFIDNLLFIAINAFISLILMLGYVYGYRTVGFQTGVLYWTVGLVVSLFMTAIFSVGFYLLGNKKGTILYFVLAGVGGGLYGMARFLPIEKILDMDQWTLVGIGFVNSVIVLFVSYWACLKLYTRRHS